MFKVDKYDVDINGAQLSYAQVCQKVRKAVHVEVLENEDMCLSGRKRGIPDDFFFHEWESSAKDASAIPCCCFRVLCSSSGELSKYR
jgi:hypothetical protein